MCVFPKYDRMFSDCYDRMLWDCMCCFTYHGVSIWHLHHSALYEKEMPLNVLLHVYTSFSIDLHMALNVVRYMAQYTAHRMCHYA